MASKKPENSQAGSRGYRSRENGSVPSLLVGMRRKAQRYASLGMYRTAGFLANAAISSSDSSAEEVLGFARICYLSGQLQRAIHLIRSRKLEKENLSGRLLVAQCLFDAGDFEECLTVLGEEGNTPEDKLSSTSYDSTNKIGGGCPLAYSSEESEQITEIQASLCVMRGRVNEETANISRAVMWYQKALKWDIHCYEAFSRLVDSGLMSVKDIEKFAAANFEPSKVDDRTVNRCTPTTASASNHVSRDVCVQTQTASCDTLRSRSWLNRFYLSAIQAMRPTEAGSLDSRDHASILAQEGGMKENADVMALHALRLYQALEFKECLRVTRTIMAREPYGEEMVTALHLVNLLELKKKNELFRMAHTLAENTPRSAMSWLAVGYYYFSCDQFDISRRYFQKATRLDPRLLPAWIAFGHAFAEQSESDQAMAAYRTASRMFPGAGLPRFYMAIEYTRQSNFTHARSLLEDAQEASPFDPAPHHQLGVVSYQLGEYERARNEFSTARALYETVGTGLDGPTAGSGRRVDAEEATLFNLGHCYRRLERFSDALQCYERCLTLKPQEPSTYEAMGITLHCLGDFLGAVEMYHRALRFSPERPIVVSLLERALEDMFQ